MKERLNDLIVIIPAYEPPKDFVEYAKTVSAMAKNVVVVNDGSNSKYDDIFDTIAKNENVVYISYPTNKGKGFALKTAFQYCIDNFDANDIIVTADCDGQHKVNDIYNVYKASIDHRSDLVLGSRDFNQENVPKRSRIGNINTRRMFRFFYGINIYDTQTGLRGFTVDMAKKFITVKGSRFEYEMAVLIYAKKHYIPITETPIETVYPDNPEDHVSHYKTFRDSMRVLGVMFRNLNFYLLSCALSAVLDVTIFFFLSYVVFTDISAVYTLIATVSARVGSSILNFALNYKYVFDGCSKKSIIRYYILWLCQLGASYGIVFLFGNIIGFSLVITKAVGDLLLSLASYQIQNNWVFKKKDNDKFYGPIAKLAIKCGRLFSKSYRCNVLPYDEPVIYVCRHLNMHGPYTTLKWLKFHVHPYVFSPFFNKKDCYNQYANYTFTVRHNRKKKRFNFKAFLASRFVPLLVNSLRAIPVYRKSTGTIKTFRATMKCLNRNESVLIYPDIEYTADNDHISDIYNGFLYLGEMYKKKTGKELKFVPIYIDDEKQTINQADYVIINNFRQDKEEVARYIKLAINGQVNSIEDMNSLDNNTINKEEK